MQLESPKVGQQTEMNFDALQQIFTDPDAFAGWPHY